MMHTLDVAGLVDTTLSSWLYVCTGYPSDPQLTDEDSYFWESTYAPFYSGVLKQAAQTYYSLMSG